MVESGAANTLATRRKVQRSWRRSSGYCRERGLFPEQVERWWQAAQDANEKPVLTRISG